MIKYKNLNIFLWIAQGLLVLAFGFAGVNKTFSPIPDLATQLGWPGVVPEYLVRIIGISELLAAIGLVLPALLNFKPRLTIWAAVGLVVVMVLALLFHLVRGEYFALPINLGFGLIALFIAYGRNKILLNK